MLVPNLMQEYLQRFDQQLLGWFVVSGPRLKRCQCGKFDFARAHFTDAANIKDLKVFSRPMNHNLASLIALFHLHCEALINGSRKFSGRRLGIRLF